MKNARKNSKIQKQKPKMGREWRMRLCPLVLFIGFICVKYFKKVEIVALWEKRYLPILGKKKVETKRKNIFDSIHVLWCIWWIHLRHFGNYIKFFCSTHKSPLWIGFQRFFVIFLWCVLMLKVIFYMGPISSFTQINWNELQLKIWKLSQMMVL